MNADTLVLYTWNSPNQFNYRPFVLHEHDYTPELAVRLARILTGDNHILRSQVHHAWWEGDTPHQTRTDIAFDGTATVRTANYTTTRHGITLDSERPYSEENV